MVKFRVERTLEIGETRTITVMETEVSDGVAVALIGQLLEIDTEEVI